MIDATRRPMPCCGHPVDDASIATDPAAPCAREGGPTPAAGDVSICFYCAAIGVYTGNGLEVRQPSALELAEFLSDPAVEKAAGDVLAYLALKPETD